jgi:hypothetical protein
VYNASVTSSDPTNFPASPSAGHATLQREAGPLTPTDRKWFLIDEIKYFRSAITKAIAFALPFPDGDPELIVAAARVRAYRAAIKNYLAEIKKIRRQAA